MLKSNMRLTYLQDRLLCFTLKGAKQRTPLYATLTLLHQKQPADFVSCYTGMSMSYFNFVRQTCLLLQTHSNRNSESASLIICSSLCISSNRLGECIVYNFYPIFLSSSSNIYKRSWLIKLVVISSPFLFLKID